MEKSESIKKNVGRPKVHQDSAARQKEFRKRRNNKVQKMDQLLKLLNKHREEIPIEIRELVDSIE